MAQVINTNTFSLNSQRSLNRSQMDMQTALQRLSSGLRINSAKDDAAGLAISQRFTAQIRGLDQANRNANDGISLLQTAEGALAETTTSLQRMRELAVQAMNATVGSDDKASLNQEFQALSAEIQRNADTTKFNGVNLIGADSTLDFQVGYQQGANNKITVSTQNVKTASGLVDIFGGGAATSTTVTSTTTSYGTYTSYTFSGNVVTGSANVVTSAGAAYTNYTFSTSGGASIRTGSAGATVTGSTASTVVTSATASTTAAAGTISTVLGASAMLAAIDLALDKVSQIRADFGAAQNRLESTVRNNASIVENQSAARSRIMDADFARETANLTRTQILQQAGVAMLAQANQLPQNVLRLLQ
jgi:flagellin